MGAFSRANGALPDGWEPLNFPKIPAHTRYRVVRDEGVWVLRADSAGAASGLIRRVSVDLARYPILRWRWRVENVLEDGDVRHKSGDDYPARVYLTFDYDPDAVSLWDRVRYRTARALYGELPAAALTYIWANRAPTGSIVDNPYAGPFVKMFVLESGADHAGRWRDAERNVLEDFRRAFGREPPLLNGVALMTDSDNTGGRATAFYGDLTFRALE